MKISFIVLTYNRTDALLAVLRSLAFQCGTDHEVVIADDGSTQFQVDALLLNCPPFRCPVRHIWHPDTGFTIAAARNLAVHASHGDYLVFLDGDCVPGPSFVKAHSRLAEKGCFVNGSRVLLSALLTSRVLRENMDLPAQSIGFWCAARWRGDSNKLLHMFYWPWSLFRVKQTFKWRGIRGCNLGLWREDFFAVNGFDESFAGWGHEDADLVLRLSHAGIKRKNGFLATEVYHLWHRENQRSEESVNRQRVIERMTTGLVQAEKGMKEITPNHLVKISALN